MANRFLSDLVGTLQTYFRIASIRLKNNSNVLEIKDQTDASFLPGKMSSLHLPGSSSGLITLTAPAAVTSGTYILPATDGTTNQVLSTDGTGTLDWATVLSANNQVLSQSELIGYADSSPVVIFTPPANASILKVTADVETLFNGTSPNLSVGVAGTTSRYMATTQNDLTNVAIYEVSPAYEEDGTPDEIIVSFSAGAGATTGSVRVSVEYANPG